MASMSHRRIIASIVAASCTAVPAVASADALPSRYRSDAAQSDWATLPSSDRTDAAQFGRDAGNHAPTGFKGGDAAQFEASSKSAFPPAGFRGGDNPADHPGVGRAPSVGPTTIEVVRPERTIVRDVDRTLPLILSGTALLLVLVGVGITLIRTRIVPRPGHGH
jgi:hypothetical protein